MSSKNIEKIISKYHIDFDSNPYFSNLATAIILSHFFNHSHIVYLEQFIKKPDAKEVLTNYIQVQGFEKLGQLQYESIGLFLNTLEKFDIKVPCEQLMQSMIQNPDFRVKLVLCEKLNEQIEISKAFTENSLELMTNVLLQGSFKTHFDINLDLVNNITAFHDYFHERGLAIALHPNLSLGLGAKVIHYLSHEGVEWGETEEVKEKLSIWFNHIMPSPKYATIEIFEAIVDTLNEVPLKYIEQYRLEDIQKQMESFFSSEKYIYASSKLDKMLLEKQLSNGMETNISKLKI